MISQRAGEIPTDKAETESFIEIQKTNKNFEEKEDD